MKSYYKLILAFATIFAISYRSAAQNLTGTWEGQRTINDKTYNYTLYLFKADKYYTGVSHIKEALIQTKKKGGFNLKNLTSTGRMNANVDVKINPFEKKTSAKAQLVGNFAGNLFSYTELGLIESNTQNVQLQNETYNYSVANGKETLILVGDANIKLVKKSDKFPDEYAQYKEHIISLTAIKYINGDHANTLKYNDRGEFSFSINNGTDFDLQGISISIVPREKETDIQTEKGNNGTFSLAKSKNITASINIACGFAIPKDSIHFIITGSYNGISLFNDHLALATTPFYLTDKTTISKNSNRVISALKGYYGLDMAHHAPIGTNLDQLISSGNKLAPMWKAAFLTTGWAGDKQDITLARQLARKSFDDVVNAARNGDAEGQYLMFYEVWLGTTINDSREVAGIFLKKAADAGFLPAMYDYSLYLMKDKDYDDSYKYLTACYDKGMQLAIATIGFFYEKGYSVSKNINTAVDWYHKAQTFGDADALMRMAKIYSSGEDLEPDITKAVGYATQAAALKNAEAMDFLAEIYLNGGNGIPKNPTKALALFREAANYGDFRAMSSLAGAYLYGTTGVMKDVKTGLFWARKSAENGGADCMALLDSVYSEGKIVQRDIIKSRFWKQQAVLNGIGQKDHSARDLRMNEITSIISNIDLSDQHTLWEDSYGNHYVSNDGPDLIGGVFKSFFAAYMDRRSHQQEQINGFEYIYDSAGKKIYGGTVSSIVLTEIFMKKGQKIDIKAYGEINIGMIAGVDTPNGITGFQSYCVDPSIQHAAIMAGINNQWTYIGSDNTFTAPADGKLQIAINDIDYSNNHGYFDVVATL